MDKLSSTSSPPEQKDASTVEADSIGLASLAKAVALLDTTPDNNSIAGNATEQQRRAENKNASNAHVVKTTRMPEQQEALPDMVPCAADHHLDNESVDHSVAEDQHKENNSDMVPCATDHHLDNEKVDHSVAEDQHKENNSMTEQQETCLSLVPDTAEQLEVKIYFHLLSHGHVQARNLYSKIFDD